jgi:hypothetical protein
MGALRASTLGETYQRFELVVAERIQHACAVRFRGVPGEFSPQLTIR